MKGREPVTGCIYAPPSGGKTLDLINAYGRGLYVITPWGGELKPRLSEHNVSGCRDVRSKSLLGADKPFDAAMAVMHKLVKQGPKAGVKAISIDPFNILYDRELEYIQRPKSQGGLGITGADGWGKDYNLLLNRTMRLIELGMSGGLDFYLSCHLKKPKEQEGGRLDPGGPALYESTIKIIKGMLDLMLPIVFATPGEEESDFATSEDGSRKRRAYRVAIEDERWHIKCRFDTERFVYLDPKKGGGLRQILDSYERGLSR